MRGGLRGRFKRDCGVNVKKTLMALLGGLVIILCGMILAALMSQVPIGFSDADAATVERKFFYGLPWPCYVAEGSSSMSAFGQTLQHFPVNAMFWTLVVVFASCIPGRKIRWGRIIGVMTAEIIVFGTIAALVWFA